MFPLFSIRACTKKSSRCSSLFEGLLLNFFHKKCRHRRQRPGESPLVRSRADRVRTESLAPGSKVQFRNRQRSRSAPFPGWKAQCQFPSWFLACAGHLERSWPVPSWAEPKSTAAVFGPIFPKAFSEGSPNEQAGPMVIPPCSRCGQPKFLSALTTQLIGN